jgi:putative membrane protein
MNPEAATQVDPLRTPVRVVAAIIAVSAAASLFLCWLVFVHPPSDLAGTHLAFLPAVNAALNGLSALALIVGYCHVRAMRINAHRASMFTAFIFSTAFLATYIVNHALHGDMRFHGHGFVRPAYFALLVSHIAFSVLALPLVLITFFLSLTGRFPAHRRIARVTFPIWLYVSATGVIVYLLLASCR